ncbi:MAG: signal peptidase I [Nitrospirae bacterium]|nr:signal peptidase I [Nitrospirota bacterium]
MGETEGRKETYETGREGGGPPRGVSRPVEGERIAPPLSDRIRSRSRSAIREYTEAIVVAVLLALFIRTFIVQAFKIPSGSMIETLQIGDHILVNKFLYGVKIPYTDLDLFPIRAPHRMDIVVFKYPEDETKDFIKRVIGEPGDVVEVRNKTVYVNDRPLVEPYTIHRDPMVFPPGSQSPRDNWGPITVPEESYFVMGDNRDQSLDSRFWGFVKRQKIKGKAFVIYWSWDGPNTWVRWNRIGHLIS